MIAFILLFAAISPLLADTVTVTTADDVVDGDVSSIANLIAAPGADGEISLREAISAANNTAGADEILFDNSVNGNTIFLNIGSSNEDANADGDLDITDADGLTITGNGESNTIIDGNDAERVLDHFDGDLTITGLTIQNGNETVSNTNGGGIRSETARAAEFSMSNCTLIGSDAGNVGGGLRIGGQSTMQTLTNCIFVMNTSDGSGGGVHINGATGSEAKLVSCTFTNNTSNRFAGALSHETTNGRLVIDGCIFTGNTAAGTSPGHGGGAVNARATDGTVIITNSAFSGNTAVVNGGALVFRTSDNGSIQISGSTISGNTAGQDGGAIYFDANGSPLTIVNSTISGNRANRHGGGISHSGESGLLSLNFVTMTLNIADDDGDSDGDGGGIDISETGVGFAPTVNIHNSIVQGNTANNSPTTDDCGNSGLIGAYVSQGGNVFGSGTGCPVDLDDTTDPANLGPLQNNGGSTQTHALLAGSAAIDFAVCDTITTDQRGEPRNDGNCDAGAFEFAGSPSAPPHEFLLLADKRIEFNKHDFSEGDIHSNDRLVFKKGDPSTHTGNVTSVDRIEVREKNTIEGDVTSGDDVRLYGDAAVTGTITENATVDEADIPDVPSFSYGSENIDVAKSETRSLPPGNYQNVKLQDNATLVLSSGEYNLKRLDVGKRAVLEVDAGGGVTINIDNNLDVNNDAKVELTGGSSTDLTFNIDGSGVKFRDRVVWLGTILAPRANVQLQKEVFFKGAICAKQIDIRDRCIVVHHSSSIALPKRTPLTESDPLLSSIPTNFSLEQNYPNPFNPTTNIAFAISDFGFVKLKVYDTAGRLVKTLVNENREAGNYTVQWDATNNFGAKVASAIYLYKLQAGQHVQVKKMILLK